MAAATSAEEMSRPEWRKKYHSTVLERGFTESSINKDILCRHWDAGIFDEGLQQPGLELQFDQGFDDVVP